MKKVLKWIGIAFAILIVIGAISSSGEKSNTPEPTGSTSVAAPAATSSTPAPEPEPQKPDLEILDHSVLAEEYARYVIGTVQNNTDKTHTYVQVEINLYDDEDNQLGSTLANTNNLEPGGKWKFKAIILEDSATKYKIKDVSGW